MCILSCLLAVSCQEPLGMEDGKIADSQISASSEYNENHGAANARLNRQAHMNRKGGWCANQKDNNLNMSDQWIQVMFAKPTWVTGVLIQGRQDYPQWVKKYKVEYSNYMENWKFVQNNDNQDAIVSST